MKFKFLTFIIMISLLLISSSNYVIAGDHDDEHEHEGTSEHTSSEQCETATTSITVIGGANEEIKFDKSEYKVAKNTCVEVTFQNISVDIDHDMNIDEVSGESGIAVTHLHQANKFDGPNGDGTITLNIQTPDADTEFDMYCSVAGHRAAGMESKLIVGEGNPDDSSLPAFEIFGALFSLSFIVLLMKRRNQ